jgi:hypothetical protein
MSRLKVFAHFISCFILLMRPGEKLPDLSAHQPVKIHPSDAPSQKPAGPVSASASQDSFF